MFEIRGEAKHPETEPCTSARVYSLFFFLVISTLKNAGDNLPRETEKETEIKEIKLHSIFPAWWPTHTSISMIYKSF